MVDSGNRTKYGELNFPITLDALKSMYDITLKNVTN